MLDSLYSINILNTLIRSISTLINILKYNRMYNIQDMCAAIILLCVLLPKDILIYKYNLLHTYINVSHTHINYLTQIKLLLKSPILYDLHQLLMYKYMNVVCNTH